MLSYRCIRKIYDTERGKGLMDKHTIIWAVIFVLAVIIEMASMQLISIWFAFGALIAFLVSFFLPFGYQLAVFVIATGLLLISTRPLLKKLKKPIVPTNHELDVGQTALVFEDINVSENTGRVRLKGVDWNAVSENGELIGKDESVVVRKIQGTKLIVSAKNSSDDKNKEKTVL